MNKRLAASLTSVASAARELEVPRSTLNYRILLGDVRKHIYGPFTLIDVEEAREALRLAGYQPRQRQAV